MHHSSSYASQQKASYIIARFFWRFTCAIDDEPIPWLRRMDRRIFQYLLLAPDGRATRDTLQSVFWPDQDAKVSQLSLRSACSNIRKAIGMLVGTDESENYFATTDDTISVNLERTSVDVRRYIAHIRSGNTCYATNDVKTAYIHFTRALAIYRGHIGWGDEQELWLEPLANECAELQRTAIEHLAQISRENGAVLSALEYDAMLSAQGSSMP